MKLTPSQIEERMKQILFDLQDTPKRVLMYMSWYTDPNPSVQAVMKPAGVDRCRQKLSELLELLAEDASD